MVDLASLEWKILHQHDLDDDELRYVVRLLRSQQKGKGGRPRTALAIGQTALDYQWEHGCFLDAGIAHAMTIHGVTDPRYVKRCIAEFRAELKRAPIASALWTVAGAGRRFEQERSGKWSETK